MQKSPLRKALLVLAFQVLTLNSFSQETFTFKTALAAAIPSHYGRDAVVTDPLAYALFSGTLATPAEGSTFALPGGSAVKWTRLTVDTAAFRMRPATGGGYLYLSYKSAKARSALLSVSGNNGVFVNGVPHMGDPYAAGYLAVPVALKKGLNEFYVRGINGVRASLLLSPPPVVLAVDDATLPMAIVGDRSPLTGAVVVINTTNAPMTDLSIRASLASSTAVTRPLPAIPAMSIRKVPFGFSADGITAKGKYTCKLTLIVRGKDAGTREVTIEAVNSGDKYKKTFVSGIDGSLQYYAVTPKSGDAANGSALFLSVHGAGVEAISQARAYHPKDWGNLVAATNRRPRGFNWEDWGRLDALEVLDLAKKQFAPDPQRIYLTGHSMGGHGTWFLGATYPDKWAGLGICSGYPTLKTYGSADGQVPDSSASQLYNLVLRAGNQSDVPRLVTNYKPLGIYILHGDADDNVPVSNARQMRALLAGFHPDYSYHEVPGAGHWFGDESVDWDPLFDFFKWHKRLPDSVSNAIDFITSSPGISASMRWATVWQQQHPLAYSRIRLERDLQKGIIAGTLENVALLKLSLADFGKNRNINLNIGKHSIDYHTTSDNDSVFLARFGADWRFVRAPGTDAKGPHRYGTFKEPFNKRMVLVYGTTGTAEENEWATQKARFDAETWYYRGNGALDVLSDEEYLASKSMNGRNVILYGNSTTNSAWNTLLADCPITVKNGSVQLGSKSLSGNDLGALFMWPIKGTPANSVAVIAGSGLPGMKALLPNQYFAGGSGFPDYLVYRLDMLMNGTDGIAAAGYYTNEWKIDGGDGIIK